MHKRPLYRYVIAVGVVWAVILGLVWYLGSTAAFHTFSPVCFGFALGMLAMYIAVHLYSWK
jgi:hypothetical protein